MAITDLSADDRDLVVTDHLVLSQDGGRWSVSLYGGGSARTADDRAAAKRPGRDAA